jgi:FkbM family methyltransferase
MFIPHFLSGKIFKAYLRSFEHPSKIRIQNSIGNNFFSKGIMFKNEEQCIYKLDANDWISRIFLLEGDYEQGSTGLAKSIMKDGGLFVDIGANFGLFTCQVAKQNSNIKVIAVEPNYKIISRLLKNLELNGIEPQVQVLNMAVSSRPQLVSMHQPAADNAGTTQTVAGMGAGLSVMSTPLGDIFDEAGVQQVKLLKIDIEGNEFDILEGFDFDRYDIENIILEFNHLSRISFDDLRRFFEQKGFGCNDIYGKPLQQETDGIPENNIWFVNRKKW